MKPKIGVMGSSTGKYSKENIEKAKELGKYIALNDCILINGATTGLPYEAAKSARKHNGLSIGISPAANEEEHINRYKLPIDGNDIIIYIGFGLKGRNVINIRASDAIVVIKGAIGTLNEFTIAYDEGKIIGVLENTSGISEYIKEIIRHCNKKTDAIVIYEKDPKLLIEKIIKNVYRIKK
jgi:hypothetical protein